MSYYSTFRGQLDITSDRSYPEELVVAAKNAGYELLPLSAIEKDVVTSLNAGTYAWFFDISGTRVLAGRGEPGPCQAAPRAPRLGRPPRLSAELDH